MKGSFHKALLLGAAATATLTLASPAAFAADADNSAAASASGGKIEEVVVTAERRAESIMNVPVAVSALSGDQLSRSGVASPVDLSGAVPSLEVNSPYGNSQPNFTIRGIGVANEHNPNQASPVGIYVDDAYIAASPAHGLQLYDLARVEILRGPQGTLYGRNTTGGAINFISRQPSLSGSNGNIEIGYANYNTVTAEGAYETTFVDGKAGFRGAFNYAHGDGFMQNIFPGQPDANSTDSIAGRAIFRVKPTAGLDITLKFSAGRANPTQAGVYEIGTGAGGYNPVLDYSPAAHGLGFWKIDSNRLGHSFVSGYGTELVIKEQFTDSLQLSSLTSFDRTSQAFTQEGTGVNSPVFTQPLDTLYGNKFDDFNQEERLSYSTDTTHAQGGVYFGYDKDNSNSYYWLLDGAAMINQRYVQTRWSYAAYGQVDQQIGSHVTLTAGLRYTSDLARYTNYSSFLAPGSSFNGQRDTSIFDPSQGYFIFGGYNPTTGNITSGPALRMQSDRLTTHAAIKYAFESGQMVYFSYSTGYRIGAFCGQCFLGPAINTTKPEKVTAYELGTKGLFLDDRLSVMADIFLMDYNNQQINEVIGADTILENINQSQIKGVEFEGTYAPTSSLKFSLSGSYLDAVFQQATLTYGSLNGYQEPYTAKWSLNGRLDWQFANFRNGVLTFSPNVIYTSKVYFSPYDAHNGNQHLMQPSNVKVNAVVSYDTPDYTLSVWVKNLTNQKTFEDGLDLRESFGYDYMIPDPPRQFGVSLNYNFD